MELKTNRLLLVPCTKESVLKYVCSLADATSHVKNCLEKLEEETCSNGQTWLLIEQNKGIVVGEIVITKDLNRQGRVHVSYQILSYARNKGYAVEALNTLFSWVFTYGGVQAITADSSKADVHTKMTLAHLGMKIKNESISQTSWELKKETSELVR